MVHLSAWSHDQLFFYISQTTATQWLLILIYFIFLIVRCSHYNDLTIFTKHIKLCLPLPRLYDLIKKIFHCKTAVLPCQVHDILILVQHLFQFLFWLRQEHSHCQMGGDIVIWDSLKSLWVSSIKSICI